MNLNFPLLTAEQIEVKVKQCSAKGAMALLYKTARTDMDMLDSVVGPTNWQRSQEEIKGNLYCTISVWDGDKNAWIAKSDCGIESRSDGDGNEKKGEASDAFKRAGTNWGIGRELYTSPFIFMNVPTKRDERSGKYVLQNPFMRFDVADIGYDSTRHINRLVIQDNVGNQVFTFGIGGRGKKPVAPAGDQKPAAEPPADVPVWSFKEAMTEYCKAHNLAQSAFVAFRSALIAGGVVDDIPSSKMTKDDAEHLFKAIEQNYPQED